MKHIIYLTSILLSLFFVSCEKDAEILDKNKEVANEQKDDSDNIVKGIVRVKLAPEIVAKFSATKSDVVTKSGNDALDAYMQEIGAKSMTRVIAYDEKFEERHRDAGLHLWYDIEFDESKPTTKVTNDIKNLPGVDYVGNIYKITRPKAVLYEDIPIFLKSIATKSFIYPKWDNPDEYLQRQWNFNNDGTHALESRVGADINLYKAWNLLPNGVNPKIIVAVLDSGVDGTHPDLQGNLWTGGDNGSWGKNYFSYGQPIVPDNHGTHVAGIIAAVNNNGKGVCGIAGGNGKPNTGVKIMNCQLFPKEGTSTSLGASTKRIMEAFTYAANHGAIIAQNSWNCGYGSLTEDVRTGIKYFIDNAKCDGLMQGGIVIFSAGNDNSENKIFPASEENVIAVAGIQANFEKSCTSNYGSWVDICAPGGIINYSKPQYSANDIISTTVGGRYNRMGGTSMACPHVSGVAALIISKFGSSTFTSKDLKDRLLKAVSKYDVYDYNPTLKDGKKLGVGLIDAYKAVAEDTKQKPDMVDNVQSTPAANTITLKWKAVNDDDDVTAALYNVYYSTGAITNKDAATKLAVPVGYVNVGDAVTAKITGLTPETKYYIAIESEDTWGNKSGLKELEVTTTKADAQTAPVLTVEGSKDIKVEQGKTASVTIKVTDKLGWKYKVDGAPAGITYVKNADNIKLDVTKDAPVGKHIIKVTVTNDANLSAFETINIEVTTQGGTTPEGKTLSIVKPIDAVSLEVNGNKSINLGEFFSDSNGNAISYTAVSDNNVVADATVNGATLSVKAVGEGVCNVIVIANNGKETLNSSFKVTVSKNGGSTPDNFNELAILSLGTSVSNVLGVKINSRVNNCNLVIAGTTGKVFVNKDLSFGSDAERNLNINVAKLAAGAYVLKVSSNGETLTQHFVKF